MRTVAVVPYEKQWPVMFKAESSLIQALLGEVVKDVHHIGSTSVPGLSAKPVIDILLEVHNINELDKYNLEMVRAGYIARGENGIPGRRYFIKGGDQRSHQVHAFSVGDIQVLRHLAFRDYLIKNSDVAESYAEIKRAAAFDSKNDVHRYSMLKASFIEHHLQLALMNLEK
ncbi:GrpB family protein [Serratia marcescens]|uniref:GrpB family protein n=1 Tax=Serratia marcescens TaxID=615 RepID=A0ABX5NK54_SERMA|nr:MULTISPECIES: GrpB family protein [Serratia]KKO56296.1 grpB family protein [Serratia ureilytica]MDI9108166.1 GrpB family protein [Serratia marcescens]MDR8491459.1 GrpB family protein [Serratia nevei]MDR8536185.1 GrpB family protein [Serratia nevei]PXZ96954.1 GrpB family protein [Serratia marcescens]